MDSMAGFYIQYLESKWSIALLRWALTTFHSFAHIPSLIRRRRLYPIPMLLC